MILVGASGAAYAIDAAEAPRVGGQALVYRARCLDDGRVVALKVGSRPGEDAVARSAAVLLALGAHPRAGPRVVPVWDTGEWEARPFLVMEWLPETLTTRIAGLPLDGRLALARQLVGAVSDLHAAGAVHGDIKPSNVIFADDIGPFLSDPASPRMFTPGFAPPEQIACGTPDSSWDRFALAAVVWRMIAGEGPTAPLLALEALDATARAALAAGRHVDPRRAFRCGHLSAATPEDRLAFDRAAPERAPLRRALEALLEPDPRRRSRSLVPLAEALGARAAPDPPVPPPAVPSRIGVRWRPALIAGVLLLGVLSLLASLQRPQPSHDPGGCPPGYVVIGSACADSAGRQIVQVPAGHFVMGPGEEDGRYVPDASPHAVTLTRAIWVDVTEVTQREWVELTGAYPMAERTSTSRDGVEVRCDAWHDVPLVGPNLPAVCLSWQDAVAFANARSAHERLTVAYRFSGETATWDRTADGWRLPTEAEWEWIARGSPRGLEVPPEGTGPWAGAPRREELCGWANLRDASALETWGGELPCDDGAPALAAVGGRNENAFGVRDMLGNALEWTWDLYGVGTAAESVDPVGPAIGAARVQRGGSWNHVAKGVAARYASGEAEFANVYGVRLVRYVTSTRSSGPSSTNSKP